MEAIPTGVSEPVTLAGGETPDTWTTFVFVKPIPVDNDLPAWVAVLVTRGSVTWSLAAGGANKLRRGGASRAVAAWETVRHAEETYSYSTRVIGKRSRR